MIKRLLLCIIAAYLMVFIPKNIIEAEEEPDYLCFTNVGTSQLLFSLERINNAGDENVSLEYRIYSSDSWGSWQTFDYLNDDEELASISLYPQEKVQIRNTSDVTKPFSTGGGSYYNFLPITRRGELSVSGDITTLINKNGNVETLPNYCFYNLFNGFDFLVSSSDLVLPSKTLGDYCYSNMFYYCNAMESSPSALPATTIGSYCYSSMFEHCEALESSPTISAINMAPYCYNAMFSECHNLLSAPELPATNLAEHCYDSMFANCSILPQVPELPAIVMKDYCYRRIFSGCNEIINGPLVLPALELKPNCYEGMFLGCGKLQKAPEIKANKTAEKSCYQMFGNCKELEEAPKLSATKLANNCYDSMFSGCIKLKSVSSLPAKTLAPSCYAGMFSKCNELINPPELPAVKLADSCYKSMFSNCQKLESAPELPAKTLFPSCYESMFSNCIALKNAPALPAKTLANSCYSCMFMGCSSLTETPALPAKTLARSCYYFMFRSCKSLVAPPALPATKNVESICYSGMFDGCTNIKISNTQDDTYTIPYRIPSDGAIDIDPAGEPLTINHLFNYLSVIDSDKDGVITLYLKAFAVTYDANDGTGSVPIDENPYVYKNSVLVLDTTLTKDGMYFNGWNTKNDGTGITYMPGDTFDIKGDTTLYAIWEKYFFYSDSKEQTYVIDSNKDITFRCNGEYANFLNVYMDGSNEPLSINNYSARSGSTIITLTNSYLNSLENGWHILKAEYNDGEATVRFYIKKKSNPSSDNRHIVLNTGIN